MNTDFRIKIGFSRHTKALKLKRRLGADGVLALIALWEYTALNKPDGLLSGMDCEDIALAAGWEGDSEHLVQTLVKVGWLDETPDGYRVHDWEQHNEWAAKAEDRSEYFRTWPPSANGKDASPATAERIARRRTRRKTTRSMRRRTQRRTIRSTRRRTQRRTIRRTRRQRYA